MKVRPYNKRSGWKDGGVPKDENEKLPKKDSKSLKPSSKYKWYLGKDGMVHIVSVGRFNKVTEIDSFMEAEATREQSAMLQMAVEEQSLAK